jgi:glycerate kinase
MDASGADVPRGGRGLGTVIRLELDELRARLHGVRIELALDVDNPLYGPSGAAAVYGPQKGATHEQVIQLDAALRQWAAVVARTTGVDRSSDPGAGAAGGAGFAALAVLGAEPRMGVELLAEVVGLESRLPGADLVITGEGSLDEQTLRGKTIAGVCRLARAHGVPVAAIAGVLRLTGEQQRELGLVRAVALSDLDPRRSFTDAARLVSEAAARLVTAATGYGGDADQ